MIFKEDLEIIFGKRPFEKEVTQKKETIDETKKSQVTKTETTTKSSKKSA